MTAVNFTFLCRKTLFIIAKTSHTWKYFLAQVCLQKTFIEKVRFRTRNDPWLLFPASTVSNTVAVWIVGHGKERKGDISISMERSPQESGHGNNICIYSLLTAQAKPPVKILKLGFNVMVCVRKRETKSHHKPHVLRRGLVCVNITVNHQGRPEPLLAGQRTSS